MLADFEQSLSMSWWIQTESAQVYTRSEYDLLPGVWLPLVVTRVHNNVV